VSNAIKSQETRVNGEARVVVVGAGIGGLSAAIDLASGGIPVTVVERSDVPGGKMHEVTVAGRGIDSGPTVFTMRRVFEELFETAGAKLAERLELVECEILARHSWADGSRLDLFTDPERSAAAIGDLAGPREADGYRRFARDAGRVFDALDHAFMRRDRPGPFGLTLALGARGVPRLMAASPFSTLWKDLAGYFSEPRLRQLFGRYATYCGSSPFEAPATLMLITHAERLGVWCVDGGLQRLAETLADLATELGVDLRYGTEAAEILTDGQSVSGVRLADGGHVASHAVVYNGDVAALPAGLLGDGVRRALPPRPDEPRSLSAMTWSVVGTASGFPLAYHTVFFGRDYPDEFEAIFGRGEVTAEPTIYVCAQDRLKQPAPAQDERLFLLVNAPPRPFDAGEADRVEQSVYSFLAEHGLEIAAPPGQRVRATPDDYASRFPGSGGAIYGWPTHGAFGSFRRAGARSDIGGLYFAGGTVHPGPGVPMTALSGRIAARAVREQLSG